MSIVLVMAVVGAGVSFVDGRKEGRAIKSLPRLAAARHCTIDAQPDLMIQVFRPPISFASGPRC